MAHTDVEIRMMGPDERGELSRIAEDVFDGPIDAALADEFLCDPRHHLAVATVGGEVVGFASAVHYVHPDKPPQLFVNEVGVALAWRRRGLARRLLETLLARGKALGCVEAWVGTEVGNAAARALYASAGGVEDPEPFVLFTFPLETAKVRDG